MKFEFDKRYLKVCVYAFCTLAALLLFQRLLSASNDIWQSFQNGLSFILVLLSPFITAIFIAYLLSPAVTGIEMLIGKIFRKPGRPRLRKLAALIIVYLLLLAMIGLALSYVIPEIVRNITELIRNLPSYFLQWKAYYNNTLLNNQVYSSILANPMVQEVINKQSEAFKSNMLSNLNGILTGIGAFTVRLLSSIASGILGLVLSFYLLNEREAIVYSVRHLLKARLGDKRGSGTMSLLGMVDSVFGKYISAKLLTSVILFILAQIVFSFLGVRYSVLMSAIIALTNLVPYIGPFIGAVPPIVISLLEDPMKALYVAIAILLLQSVDNYFIGPYVIGDKMGLSPFWILLSIILGGGLFGLWGILLAVPAAAVIKLLIDRYIKGRILNRQHDKPRQDTPAKE
jgi:predicted PurR-regulated permease PerM